jgi:hypothetical protein
MDLLALLFGAAHDRIAWPRFIKSWVFLSFGREFGALLYFRAFFFLAVFWTRRPPWQCSAIRLWIQARLHPFNTTTPNNQQ